MNRRSASWLPTLLGAALLSACAEEETIPVEETTPPPSAVAAAPHVPPGVTEAEVERGRELFLPCAVCHGLDGRGNSLGPSLRDSEWIHISGSLTEIERVILTGVPQPRQYPVPMVPMGGGDFDAAELRSVAAYVYAISRPAQSATPAPSPPAPGS